MAVVETTTRKKRARTPPLPTARLIGAKFVEAEYGIRYTTIRDLVHKGEIPVLKLGRAWYFERCDIETFIASRKELAAR